ncbi:ADOP family duplicated permease [Edaphobacter albus]|uniref:ADOP family duplicated permease n=1 Tax=Edaphobacter sp. 4G125 TaxID=2763071 RepID=UPI0016486112|nr:ADOP family duplicated permease [Edaphobacter sp. 4G125]QNI37624.1 ABC transporter permease [Edaphobacter sp. 4G125]
MGELWRRMWYLLNRQRMQEELRDEMEFHREMAESAGAERRLFGNADVLREQAREAWGWTWIDRLFQDIRFGMRTLTRSPGFTIAAVLVLAVGIGVNVAAFGVFDMFVLKPLPVRDPDTLVRLERKGPGGSFASNVAYPSVEFYRDHAKTLSAVLVSTDREVVLENESKQVRARFVTGNFFHELGAETAWGRLLNEDRDERKDAAPVVVLSHTFWEERYNSDPAVVGRVVHLNHKAATVVGVAPRNFSGLGIPHEPAFWVPLTQQPYFVEGSTALTDTSLGAYMDMWARLEKGVTPKMAEQELTALTNDLRRQSPESVWKDERIISKPGGYLQTVHKDDVPMISLVATLVLLILTVACSNLGGLLLARGVTRGHEISIRFALGASRGRIVRQLFTESLLLALMAAAAGLGLGYVFLKAFLANMNVAPWLDPVPDWRVAAFAGAVGLIAAIVFGLAPALQLTARRRSGARARQVLVTAQIAASCVLLIVAGLLVRALQFAVSNDPGYDYEHILVVDPDLAAHGYSASAAKSYLDTVQARLRQLPGVISVGLTSMAPLGHKNVTGLTGYRFGIFVSRVEPGFFETMGIARLSGRDVQRGDTDGDVVVSESLAKQMWPAEAPLGKQFLLEPTDPTSKKFTVVGVVANARTMSMHDPDATELYQMSDDASLPHMVALVRTQGRPQDIAAGARTIATGVDAGLFPNVRLLSDAFHEEVGSVEKGALIASLMGASAVLLAAVGLVGLVAYAVSQKTREIAIRLALGAKKEHVLAAMLRQFVGPVALGLIAGAGLAAAASQMLRRILYGVSGLDPLSYAGAIGLLATTAALAALWPARRALRIDPMEVLRHE